MPVRVKQRALESTNGGDERQLELLKREILGILLAWHLPVSVSLKAAHSKKGLCIRAHDSENREHNRKKPLRNLDITLICGLLSQCGSIEPPDRATWIKTSARTPFITIRGAISLQPVPSKHVQFISLGVHPVSCEKNGNVLYEEVNRVFASSMFGHQEEVPDEDSEIRSKDRRFKRDGLTVRQIKGGGKGIDRWPMFYIRIEMQDVEQVHNDDLEKIGERSLTGLLRVLGAMITSFLDEHHFRPRARAKTRNHEGHLNQGMTRSHPSDIPEISNKTALTHQGAPFGTWSRVKSSVHSKASAPTASGSLADCHSKLSVSNIENFHPNSQIPTQPSENPKLDIDELNSSQNERTVRWTNPLSKATVNVNARTGNVIDPRLSERPKTTQSNLEPCLSFIASNGSLNSCKRLTHTAPAGPTGMQTAFRSGEILKIWKNPIFDITEQPIPQISFDGPLLDSSEVLQGRRHYCSDSEVQKTLVQSSSSITAKLSRDGLKYATVISQVDQKFILVKLSDSSESVSKGESRNQLLALVDQHAADERLRVENLLAELMMSPAAFAKPITFELSSREGELLTQQAPQLADWGIVYDVTHLPNSQKCRISVKALPTPVAERCRVEPKILIEMLRGEAWRRAELGKATKLLPNDPSPQLTSLTQADNINKRWLSRLPACPPPLLSMINSRACRSAIMFNDVLTQADCQSLIRKLADCAFPFQCAHGRPSMVPLVEVGGSILNERERAGLDGEAELTGFGEAWNSWRGGKRET